MKTTFYLNGKKIARTKLEQLLGKEKVKFFLEEAKETFFEDCYIDNSRMTSAGILKIIFS